jgi:hypothetical protein
MGALGAPVWLAPRRSDLQPERVSGLQSSLCSIICVSNAHTPGSPPIVERDPPEGSMQAATRYAVTAKQRTRHGPCCSSGR